MRFLRAHLENFRSTATLDVDFYSDGLHGIIGPPGAGKSTIFTGLVFSLYGSAGPDQDLTDLRYDQSGGKPVVADYEWAHGGHIYRTRRELRRGTRKGQHIEKSSARMWRDDHEIDNMTASAMTAEVTSILGMPERGYTGSSMIRQGEVDILTTAAPTAVQQLVEEHTGIAALTRLRDHARRDAKKAEDHADAVIGSYEAVVDADATLTQAADETEASRATMDAATARAARAHNHWTVAAENADTLRRSVQAAVVTRDAAVSAQGRLAAARDAAAAAEQAVIELGLTPATALADLDKQWDQLRATRAAFADVGNHTAAAYRAVDDAATELAAAGQAMTATDGHQQQVAANIAALLVERDEKVAAGHEAKVVQATTTAEQQRLNKSLAALQGVDACCPTCQQSIGDPDSLRADLTALRDVAATSAATATAAIAALYDEIASIDEHGKHLKKKLDQLTALADTHTRAHATHRRAEETLRVALAAAADVLAGEVTDAADTLARIGEAIAGIDGRLASLGEQRAAIKAFATAKSAVTRATAEYDRAATAHKRTSPPSTDDVDAAIAAATTLRTTADQLAQEASTATSTHHAANVAYSQLRNQRDIVADQWQQKQEAVRDADVARTTAEVFTAYRQDLIGDFTDGISQAATELLERFGGEHVAFHLDSDFVPRVELADGRLRKTSTLSGGEKARVGLAFRLGISMQITDGGLPDQILGDEITQYLDEDGRRQVVATITDLFTCPILVSHTDEILDHATVIHRLHRPPLGATEVIDPAGHTPPAETATAA